jgi:hypothetical protein
VFFLRHFRTCGEVKLAAERTGVALSTVYRWRDRDQSFRARWDSLADQRRQMLEDRLMGLALEGEKTAVFYKGEQVGWRHSHSTRAAIALLAYFDRREKAALAAAARQREERMREPALASRSEAATEAKEAVKSDSSPEQSPRKIGNGPCAMIAPEQFAVADPCLKSSHFIACDVVCRGTGFGAQAMNGEIQ